MMLRRSLLLSIFLFGFLLTVGAVSVDPEPYIIGGPWMVKFDDPVVKEMTEFAVSEFNQEQSQKKLVLQKVVSGLGQEVDGMSYTLVIAVRDESLPAKRIVNYEDLVYERSWENFRNLESFHQVD